METPPRKKSEAEEIGDIFGIVMVVVILIAGGVYFFVMQKEKLENQQQPGIEIQANS